MGISRFSEKALKAPKSRCQGWGGTEELPGFIPVGERADPVWLSGANEPRVCTGVLCRENAGGVGFSQVGDSQGRTAWDSMDGWDLQSLAKQEYLSTDC